MTQFSQKKCPKGHPAKFCY